MPQRKMMSTVSCHTARKCIRTAIKIRSALFSHGFVAREREEIETIQKYVLYQPYSSLYIPETTNGYAAPWAKFVKLSIIKEHGVKFDPYVKGVFDDGI